MKEEYYIERLVELTENKTGWGSVESWSNYHFTMLSDEIKKVTDKRISDSTLKRIYGRKKTKSGYYNPHTYTKNIITEFLGYKNWSHFQTSQPANQDEPKRRNNSKLKLKTFIIYGGVLLVILMLFFAIDLGFPFKRNALKSISCETPVGRIPFTAVFRYELKKTNDSVMIDFGNGEKYFLAPERNMITQFYKGADYSNVIVSQNGKELCRKHVHILSNGWQGGASVSDSLHTYKPFEDQSVIFGDGRLFISPDQLEDLGIGKNSDSFVEFRNFDTFGIPVDDTDFETILKNSPEEGGKRCYDAEIILRGENGDALVRFMESGCFRYAKFIIGEKDYYGRFDDLSFLARNVSEWSKVRLSIHNKVASLFFNDELIRQESYEREIGELKGIIFRFYGNGSVDEVRLSSAGKDLIMDSF